MKKRLLICLTSFALLLSAQFSLAAVNTYDWVGGTSTDWKDGRNWKIGTTVQAQANYPGASVATDIVRIGSVAGTITNWPVLSASPTNSIASITIGTSGGTSPSLTVNSPAVLTLTGAITCTTTATYTATLSGTGTINATNLSVATTSNGTSSDISTLGLSVTALNLSGNIAISTSNHNGNKFHDITVNLTGGTTSVTGTITTTNSNAGNTSTISVASGATLKLANATALSGLTATGTNTITLSSGSTVEYSGSTAQTVYTDLGITGLASGLSYSNLTFSGSGTKTTNGTSSNNLNIGGNFINNTGSLQSIAASTAFNGTAAQTVTLGSGVTFSNITFSGSGITTVSSGTMNVTGNFTNSYTTNDQNSTATSYIDFSLPTVNFTGTGAQAIAGGTGDGTDFKNVTFSGGSAKTISSGKVNVISTGTLTIPGGTTTLAAGGFLTLESDANGSAQVAGITTPPGITGNVNVQRYLTGGQTYSRGWRLLSSPVAASSSSAITPNLTYVQSMVYSTGSGGTSGGFDATGNPSFYFYRENKNPDYTSFITGNFRGVSTINNSPASTFSFDGGDADATLPVGNGFLFFDRGDKATTTSPTSTSSIAQATTLTATGYLNQGSITVKPWFTGASTLSYTSGTSTTVRGFNLVGNPYASSINWDAAGITKTSITNTIYIYNPKLKVFATYVGGSSGVGTNFNGTSGTANIIPSGQGFFVQATSTSAALTFTEAAKVTNQVASTNLLLATATPITYLRLVLLQDSLTREDALIFFRPTANANYVEDEDANYFIGESIVHISTKSPDNHDLAVNQMPFSLTRQQVPLNVTVNKNGTYKLDLSEAKNIPSRYKIYLLDALKKDSVDITKQPIYTFTADTTIANTTSNRFYIVINQSDSLAYKLTDIRAVKSNSGVSVLWKTVNEGNNFSFTVDRSTDGGATYSTIGSVSSNGAGTYSFVDKAPYAGVNIYRIKQLDNVYGGVGYAQTSINYASSPNNNTIGVYPNPATTTIKLAASEIVKAIPDGTYPDYTIIVTNSTGNIVRSISTWQLTTWQTDISSFTPGMYFLRVINNSTKTVIGSSKFIKL